MNVEILSRIQFALTSSFHYIYPPMSIGLGLMLCIFEGLYLKTKNEIYLRMTRFWASIFALTFALGVATGLVQLFGFGTNWANYSRFVGDVFGSALGAEGIFAFFLEAGFLGVMLFGWDRVSAKMHYVSTVCVALGAHFSAVWIVVANSWMQTPTAYKIVGEGSTAKAVVTDFWQMVFNPSAMDRLTHVILGCWLTGIFLVLSVGGYYLIKRRHETITRKMMPIALWAALIVLVLQLISADSTARGVAHHQPSKMAAMEGVFKTAPRTPITVAGWVDTKEERVKGIQLPGVLSWMTYGDVDTPVKGFDQIPPDERPPIGIVFQTYHLMVMMWGLMVLLTGVGFYLWKKQRLHQARWVLWGFVFSILLPHIANQTGWMTAEIGRQPWVVYGVLRTSQGVSTNLVPSQVMMSLVMFIVIYTLLFALFLFLLDRKIKHGPLADVEEGSLYRNLAIASEGEES